MQPWTTTSLLGRVMGGYRLDSLIGSGGAGAVFLGSRVDGAASQISQAAIKVLIPPATLGHTDQVEFRARFRREAEALRALDHPHILKVFDSGEDTETTLAYMVMPFIPGGALAARMAHGPLPLNEASQLFAQLASALDYAHGRQIIHRDIKPANILLDRDGQIYLADFGLVKLFDTGHTTLTTTGQVMGTPDYMSPEQARGEHVGPPADIYSAGVVLYQMVTGQTPFQAKSLTDMLIQIVQSTPPPPRQSRPDLPAPAEAAIVQALAKKPGERFPSAGRLSEAFKLGLTGTWAPDVRLPTTPTVNVALPATIATPPSVAYQGLNVYAGSPPIAPGKFDKPGVDTSQFPGRQRPGGWRRLFLSVCIGLVLVSGAGTGLYLYAQSHKGGGGGGSTGGGGNTGGGGANVPQVLRLQATGETDLRSFDPAQATTTNEAQFDELIYPGLVVLDQNLNPIPWAASALPDVSSDGLIWTFHIRQGLKWSDGTPITAQTYAYSMDRLENPCTKSPVTYYLNAIQDAATFNGEQCDTASGTGSGSIRTLIGDSLIVSDSQTLQVRLAAPAQYFLYAMTYPASYAVPKQLIDQYGAAFTQHLADGAGFGGDLFKVTLWDHSGNLTLKRNDAFWGQKPKLSEVDITFYKDTTTAYNAYLGAEADVGVAPAAQLANAKSHATFHQVVTEQLAYYAMNWNMAPFGDIRMRQAFAIALNKVALASVAQDGAFQATNHIVPDGTFGYNSNLRGPDGTQSLSGNAQMANQLATAYATESGCGAATDFSGCPPVTLTIAQGNTARAQVAAAALQMWHVAMPGYPITISSVTFSTLLQGTGARRLQFWSLGWLEDYPDPQDWLSLNVACSAPYNAGGACDRQADGLINKADGNSDPTARAAEYQQAEQLLVTEVAWVPLYQSTTWWETQPYVKGYSVASNGFVTRESWQTMFITSH